MKNYEKPIILANDSLAEGVYAASGDTASSDCYTVTARIHQKPETGRDYYVIQADAVHGAEHHGGQQHLLLSFNQPVTFVNASSSNASLAGGNGTNCIDIAYSYHQNGSDNIGTGDIAVSSGEGLAITGAVMTCNKDCFQH
ncbi:MAG: hypothetical protein K2P45_02975 [Eubacterium sp.]|nr:hypothetical protein [Eubacterium sp.]